MVTGNAAGRAALREWVGSFCDTYQAHAAVIRILNLTEIIVAAFQATLDSEDEPARLRAS